jgi:tryptophan synthase alpha chain
MATKTSTAQSRIAETFARTRAAKATAFMPFITAGDPDLAATLSTVKTLASTGVDLIEVGFPYSDPIADGPVIQASYTRALNQGITVDAIFRSFSTLEAQTLPPLVAMVSYAIIMRRGMEKFLEAARSAGFSGLIVPDLPASEATEVFRAVRDRNLDLVQLIAPTTQRSRVREILSTCSGFVYCLAVAGITGERERVADALLDQLKWLRTETDLPLAAGFGISRPEHVATLKPVVDGVIVGSAIVKRMEAAPDRALEDVGEFSRSMVAACRKSSGTAKRCSPE